MMGSDTNVQHASWAALCRTHNSEPTTVFRRMWIRTVLDHLGLLQKLEGWDSRGGEGVGGLQEVRDSKNLNPHTVLEAAQSKA